MKFELETLRICSVMLTIYLRNRFTRDYAMCYLHTGRTDYIPAIVYRARSFVMKEDMSVTN